MKYVIILLLLFIAFPIYSQFNLDEKNFIERQLPEEKKFIAFLKAGNVDSCLARIAPSVINEYGSVTLKAKLKPFSELFLTYGEPNSSWGLCKPAQLNGYKYAVGCYGHNVYGSIEKRSIYIFRDKLNKSIFELTICYWNSENQALIKYISFTDKADFDKIKPLKPLPKATDPPNVGS